MKLPNIKLPRPTPLGWEQPVLPPLPPSETQRDQHEILYRRPELPHPSTAPGFLAAWNLGMLPQPPSQFAPSPVPGVTAGQWLASMVACVVVPSLILVLLQENAPLALLPPLTLVLTGGVAYCYRQFMRRDKIELDAGYVTRPGYTGLWRLSSRTGQVLREPDRSVPPPGWYPSPYYPGLLQRWHGPDWKPLGRDWERRPEENFRWPDKPFLDEYHKATDTQ